MSHKLFERLYFLGWSALLVLAFSALWLFAAPRTAHAAPSIEGRGAFRYECASMMETEHSGLACDLSTTGGEPVVTLTRTMVPTDPAGKAFQAYKTLWIMAQFIEQGGRTVIKLDKTGKEPARRCDLQYEARPEYFQCMPLHAQRGAKH